MTLDPRGFPDKGPPSRDRFKTRTPRAGIANADLVVEVRCAGRSGKCGMLIVAITAGWWVKNPPMAHTEVSFLPVPPESDWLVIEGGCPKHSAVKGIDGNLRQWNDGFLPIPWKCISEMYELAMATRSVKKVLWQPTPDLRELHRIRRRSGARGGFQVQLIGVPPDDWVSISDYSVSS